MTATAPGFDEFGDDHEEKHAIGAGLALGFGAVVAGEYGALAILPILVQQALERKRRPAPADRQDLANDIRRELHYFVTAAVVGGLLGAVVLVATGGTLPSL